MYTAFFFASLLWNENQMMSKRLHGNLNLRYTI